MLTANQDNSLLNCFLRIFGCSCLLLLSLAFAAPGAATGSPSEEYRLKAALIYKLAKFVKWQNRRLPWSKHFGICLLGNDEFGSALNSLNGRKIGNFPIRIQKFSQSKAIDNSCHIVFIDSSKQPFLKQIFSHLQQHRILTIGDSEKFAASGGIIQFTRKQNHIGFKINLDSASQSSLKIAAPLLELAQIVRSTDQ